MKPDIFEYLFEVTEEVMDFDFSRSQTMASHLSDLDAPPMVLIGGTNGKGSTLENLKQLLMAHGLKVGTFTSPHISDVRERICVQDQMISHDDFVSTGKEILADMNAVQERLTYFETLTFLAWRYFAGRQLDICLFEVGMGGRLDSTRALPRMGSILTRIDMDHMEYLGDTLDKIANEKVFILTPDGPNVIARQEPLAQSVIVEHTRDFALTRWEQKDFQHNGLDAPFVFENDRFRLSVPRLGLAGSHQSTNAALALEMLDALSDTLSIRPDTEKSIRALSNARVSGRMEVWRKKNQWVILDGAHNEGSIEALKNTLYMLANKQRYHVVVGFSANKKARSMMELLSVLAKDRLVTTTFDHPRAWKTDKGAPLMFEDLEAAFGNTWENATLPILCTGSLFMVGPMQEILSKYGFAKEPFASFAMYLDEK